LRMIEAPSGLALRSSGSGMPHMVILNNGNVGIGTTSPSEKLEVNGNIKMGYEIITGGYNDYNAPPVDVYCSSGKQIIGGGCECGGQESPPTLLRASRPIGNNGWRCGSTAGCNMTTYAICVNIR
ncbi:MAG: hypothetical protein AAB851_03905, partial [Patescibacteria group bacterium]